MRLDAFSYGGGVQSTAALVLAARGEIDVRLFLFANVGDDSEKPATLAYLRDVAAPFAAASDLELVELTPLRSRRPITLLELLERPDLRSVGIPMRGASGATAIPRSCTRDFKIRTIAREMRARGATAASPATIGLGISADEWKRASNAHDTAATRAAYPLLELGIDRRACERVITEAGLPIPPKSACWFCPFTRLAEWQTMRRRDPERFARAVELERRVGGRGRRRLYLTRYGAPLDEVVPDQLELTDEEPCESGYCFT